LPSDRWRDELQALLERAGLPERVVTDPDLDDDAENYARLRLLTQFRGYSTRTEIFEGFPHDVRWRWTTITPAELARVRFIDYNYWIELSGGTRLAVDAAAHIRAGVTPFGVPDGRVLRIALALECHVRLTAYMLARDRLPAELEVLAGSAPAMTRWDCW
jgi:hypothetical protein